MRRELAIVVAACLTGLMMLLIAGHGPWAGSVIWRVSPGHGLNNGDLPVLGLWIVGMGAVVLLARRD
ncbi:MULTISPECIES: hypothetical protein [unclassified Nocardioides]|uniref:hypothetical protein n=1 Tax=unclassified Nocardioides TaxID=2615069 RepID=UPI003014A0D4